MIDVSGPLQLLMRTTLKADPGVQAAFAGVPNVFDVPPVNQSPPYLVIGEDDILPLVADGFSLSEIDANVHVWSLPKIPGLAEAKAIGGAASAALLALAGSVAPGLQIYDVSFERARYVVDLDGRTAHGVTTLRFTTSPA